MSNEFQTEIHSISKFALIISLVSISTVICAILWPMQAWELLQFVTFGLVEVAPLVIPGIALSAWIMASSADTHIARAFEGRTLHTVLAASAIGAITPVCGVTVLPLMAGLLAAGIPLAPIMAFWLSSPVTDPAMLATTAATLGMSFAIGKTIAAFGLGIWGGMITSFFSKQPWATNALRQNRIVGNLSTCDGNAPHSFKMKIWDDIERRETFRHNFRATTRLVLICLVPAFAAEYALNATLQPQALASYVGEDVWWAIPFAVFIGAPAYLDGYAALPLTRGLMESGMSSGAAMAFLVAGGVVSIWGALAIFPVLRLHPFLLYLFLAVSGSMMAGYIFEWLT